MHIKSEAIVPILSFINSGRSSIVNGPVLNIHFGIPSNFHFLSFKSLNNLFAALFRSVDGRKFSLG